MGPASETQQMLGAGNLGLRVLSCALIFFPLERQPGKLQQPGSPELAVCLWKTAPDRGLLGHLPIREGSVRWVMLK